MPKTRSQSIKKEEEGSKTELKNTQLLNGTNTIVTRTRGSIAKRKVPEKNNTVKAENHSLILSIKEEEEEGDDDDEVKSKLQYSQFVDYINDTINIKDKLIKRESLENSNNALLVSQVKCEEELDTKSLLQKPQLRRGIFITQDKIHQLIKYVVSDKMTVAAASIKVNINRETACKYYNLYKNDPEQKIPDPRKQNIKNGRPVTKEQIKELIHHIESDRVSVSIASKKVNISRETGNKYYNIYKDDPEKKIPEPKRPHLKSTPPPTHNQIKQLINYITKDNMSIAEASRKIKINYSTGRRFYSMYLNDPEQKIPEPKRTYLKNTKPPTHNQIKQLINYISKDNMSILEASRRVNISATTGHKYYSMFMESPERKIPDPRSQPSNYNIPYTQDQIKTLIDCIEKDKMSVTAASRKVNMPINTARRYYLKYLNDPNHNIPIPGKRSTRAGKRYTQDRIKELISYIVDGKMTLQAASVKASMSEFIARKHYRKYLKSIKTQTK